MGFVIISDNDSRYFYKDYRIFRNEANWNLWGIKSPAGNIIIEPIFQSIEWIKGIDWNNINTLVKFKLNNKTAICSFEQMLNMQKCKG